MSLQEVQEGQAQGLLPKKPVPPQPSPTPVISTGRSTGGSVPIEVKEKPEIVPTRFQPKETIPEWKYGPPQNTAIQPATEYYKYKEEVKKVQESPPGTIISAPPTPQVKKEFKYPWEDWFQKAWYRGETGPEVLTAGTVVYDALGRPYIKETGQYLEERTSSKAMLANLYGEASFGILTGGVVGAVMPAAETSTGLLYDVYRGSKYVMTGAFVVGTGAYIGKTAYDLQSGKTSRSRVAEELLYTGAGMGGFVYGLGAKGFGEPSKKLLPERTPQQDITPLHNLKERLLTGKNLDDYVGYNRQIPERIITPISSKGFDESIYRSTALDEPYTEEFLREQYHQNPSIKASGYTERDYIKTYQGRSPRDLLLTAKELQSKVRYGATWIQDKALLKGGSLKTFSLDARIKTGLKGLDSFERVPELATEKNLGGEFLTAEKPKVTLKISKPFEYQGENRMPTPSTDVVDRLMAKVGKKSSSLLGLPDESISAPMKSATTDFSNMDEMGGFKRMYGKKTVMLLEEEERPQVSRRWENQFRSKPEKPSPRAYFSEGRGVLSTGASTVMGFGSTILNRMNILTRLTGSTKLQDVIRKQGNMFSTQQVSLGAQRDITKQDTVTADLLLSGTRQTQRQKQQLVQQQTQVQRQELVTIPQMRTITIPRQRPGTPSPPFVPFIPLLPGDDESRKKKLKESEKEPVGYIPVVHERGRWIPLTTKTLTRREATNLLANALDESKAAVGKLRPSKGRLQSLGTQLKDYSQIAYKFKEKGDLLIEKREYRMDTPGEERQITAKGWAANRLKGMQTQNGLNNKSLLSKGIHINKLTTRIKRTNKKKGRRIRYV